MGDFLLAITAKLEIMIEKTAAEIGAANASAILESEFFLMAVLMRKHQSLPNQVVREM